MFIDRSNGSAVSGWYQKSKHTHTHSDASKCRTVGHHLKVSKLDRAIRGGTRKALRWSEGSLIDSWVWEKNVWRASVRRALWNDAAPLCSSTVLEERISIYPTKNASGGCTTFCAKSRRRLLIGFKRSCSRTRLANFGSFENILSSSAESESFRKSKKQKKKCSR